MLAPAVDGQTAYVAVLGDASTVSLAATLPASTPAAEPASSELPVHDVAAGAVDGDGAGGRTRKADSMLAFSDVAVLLVDCSSV